MKTKERNLSKVAFTLFFLMASFIIAGCAGQSVSNQTEKSADVKDKVAAPKIDIHTAVVTGNLEAVQQHIDAGTDLNKKDPYGGSSPLISAALFNKPEMVKLLIDAGADLDFQNKEGSTALITAAFFGRPEIVKMLLDSGADKTIKNKYGATAYESVITPFSKVKSTYDMMGKMLEPLGLKLDYAYLEKIRPEIAAQLK
ncbi:ankyrin repeat domain-containing protein [Olivibacter domesticus]|nr:ankyrin repeat domain-containing protein [Olivibacter domesticus]